MAKLNDGACQILTPESADGQVALNRPKDLTPVVFLVGRGDILTWRGVGQEIPYGMNVVGTGLLFCPQDGISRYPLGIFFYPSVDQYQHPHLQMIIERWKDPTLFKDHYVTFVEEPLAVRLQK